MLDWIKKNWLPAALSATAGALALMVYEKHAKAATPPVPSSAPASAQVGLQPGATTVSVSKNGNVVLTLPTGASWASGVPIKPLNPTAVQPTGNIAFNVQMSAQTGVFPLTALWTDASGNAQTTTINISVS